MNFPVLETERLVLNRPTAADLPDFIAAVNSSEDFSKNLFNIPFPYTSENGENWMKICNEGIETGNSYRFAIREKNEGKLIGIIGLHLNKQHHSAELGYLLHQDFWNKGYLTEGLKEVVKFGFENLDLNKIYATHFLYNPASGRVMQKVGMKLEGTLREEYFQHGKFCDVHRYSILKSEF